MTEALFFSFSFFFPLSNQPSSLVIKTVYPILILVPPNIHASYYPDWLQTLAGIRVKAHIARTTSPNPHLTESIPRHLRIIPGNNQLIDTGLGVCTVVPKSVVVRVERGYIAAPIVGNSIQVSTLACSLITSPRGHYRS